MSNAGFGALTALPPVVVIVAKGFQRPDIPRARQESRTLVEAGYRVFVLAWDRYGEFPTWETVDGATVRSFTPVNLTSFSRLGLAIGGLVFQVVTFFATLRLIKRLNQRPILHAHDINTFLPCCLLRLFRLSSALVYDCREVTYGVYSDWFHPVLGGALSALEGRCLRYADAVITVSDAIADYLHRFSQVVEVIYNCPRIADIPKVPKRDVRTHLGLPLDAFLISSVGTIRYDSRLDLLLAIASRTKKENIHFLVVGDGPLATSFRKAAETVPDAKITILPRMSREKALAYVYASDLTWSVYRSSRESLNAQMTLPWKFFESLACGVPAMVEAGTFQARIASRFQCGLVSEDDSLDYVCQLITSLANDSHRHTIMCNAARTASKTMNFSWEAMARRLVTLYWQLGRPSRRSHAETSPSGMSFRKAIARRAGILRALQRTTVETTLAGGSE